MKNSLFIKSIQEHIVTGSLFLLAAIIYFYVYHNFPVYFPNDTGVELLQVREFSVAPLKTYITSYKGGGVDDIESFYGYYMAPFIYYFGDGIPVFQLGIGIFFALTVVIFYFLLCAIFELPMAVLGALLYMTSAYAIWWPLMLLRNSFAPFFLIGALYGIIHIFKGRVLRGFLVTVLCSVVGVFSYSSLKTVLPMILLSAMITAVLSRNKAAFFALLEVGFTVAIILLWLAWSTQSTDQLLTRGKWVLDLSDFGQQKNIASYLKFYSRSLLLPVYENPNGFLADPTHTHFNRSILPVGILWMLWVGGIITIIYRAANKNIIAIFLLSCTVLSSAILCMAGPSLKTHFCLAPLTFIVVLYGLSACTRLAKTKIIFSLALVFIGFNFYQEINFMRTDVNERTFRGVEADGQEVGQYLAKHNSEFDFVVFSMMGADIARLYYPDWFNKSIWLKDTSDNFLNQIESLHIEHEKLWLILDERGPYYKELTKQNNFCIIERIRPFVYVAKKCDTGKAVSN